MKKLAISFALVGLSCAVASAETPLIPLLSIGEEAAIRALLSASVAYNDNIYLSESGEKSDTIFTISPGLEFASGEVGRNKFSFRFVENFLMYMDESDNNAQLENFDATFSHGAEGDKLKLTTAAGFHHNQSVSSRDRRNGKVVRSYNYYANAIASYLLGEKLSVRGGFKWTGTTYDNSRYDYNDRQQYAIPVYLYYAVTEKLNAGLTAEYRYVDLAASGKNKANAGTKDKPGTQDVWFLGLSAEGYVWSKLSLKGRIGYTTSDYNHRNIDGNDGSDTLGMSITADYKATEKLLTSLTVNRDFDLAGDASGITETGVTLRAVYTISEQWSANGSLGYRNDDYESSSREDDYYMFSVGAAYAITDYASIYANYSLAVDDSNRSGCDYTNNIITVGVSIRY